MDFIIREATGADAEKMLHYNNIVGGETDFLSFGSDTFNISAEKEARFLERFKNSKKDLMLVALDGDKIVANASVEGNRTKRYAHRAELSITVLQEYWGKGIGSALMDRLISFSKSTGYKSLYLDVRGDNGRAISLYKKFGFEKIGVYDDYFNINGKYYPAILMVLHF